MRFTVRRPPIGEVSPCCHRPPGGDIARSVDVGVAPASGAGFAFENRLALAVPRSDMPAHRALLRRERGRDLLDPTVSFVLQSRGELPPSAAADRPIQPALLSDAHTGLLHSSSGGTRHRPHIEGLDPNHLEAARNISRRFLDPILAPVNLTGSQIRDRRSRPRAMVGPTFGPGESPLQHPQALSLTCGQTGYMQQFAGRQRRRDGNATVDTDHAAVTWAGNRLRDVGERNMPAASTVAANAVGLHPFWHRPGQAKPQPPHLRRPHPTEAAVQQFDVMRFQPDLPKPFMHTGFTPRRAPVCAAKIVLHGLCEIPQRLLLHRLAPGTKPRKRGARLGQLRALFHIAGSLTAWLPMLLLLHRQIPHKPRIPAVSQQDLLLLRGRQQPKPRHSRKVTTTTTDNPGLNGPAPLRIGLPRGLKPTVSGRRCLDDG